VKPFQQERLKTFTRAGLGQRWVYGWIERKVVLEILSAYAQIFIAAEIMSN